jgi:pseudomonalisin
VRPSLRSLAPVFSAFVLLLAALLCLPLEAPLEAQTAANSAAAALQPMAQANRVSAQANLSQQTKLTGHIPAWATADRQTATSVDLSASMNISLVLRRDPSVEAAFEKLLADQQNPASPHYHQWLTPQQIGTLYGPTQADLDAITSWATGQGLKLVSVQPNRVIVELTGSTAQVASAFRTSFAYFTYNEGAHLSATIEPSIPTALFPVIDSIHGLTQLPLKSYARFNSKQSSSATGAHPNLYNGAPGQNFIMPNDFAVIYDLASIYSSGNTGAKIGNTTQKIAIIGRSRVAATDISEFESIAALPSVQPTVIIPTSGVDPGTTGSATDGDQGEATLDVDRVISTAYGAEPDLVVSGDVSGTDGVYIAAAYNVNVLKDPIMTISFGSCEQSAGASGVNLWNTLFSSAAGEGISVFVSSGDEGAAGCDDPSKNIPAKQVLSPNSICASSYATCVGGTEFNDTANLTLYWRSSNGTGDESAISYIPEGAWNESGLGTGTEYVVLATGGGVSSFITKPTWQTGTGVPNDGFRDTPDVAFTAADHDGYFGCLAYSGGDCSASEFEAFSGTSAAAPSMAGIAALLNTKMGSQQGNLNPLLYQLAASSPTAFHDTTVATSGVTGCTLATPSMCNNSTPAPTTLTGGLAGYEVGTGYDQATGLGSLDVANFLTAAASTTPPPAKVSTTLATTVAPNPATVNQSVTLTATLTPSNTTAGAATGTVQFSANGNTIGSPVSISGNVATLAQPFTTAGTYAITAVYAGDANYSTSTAPAVSLVVNSAATGSFTLSPSPATLTLAPGATTGNADTITLTSTNGFAGSVGLVCAITFTGTGTASLPPVCNLSAPSVSLTATNGTGTVTATIATVAASTAGSCSTASLPSRGPVGMMLAGVLLLVLPVRKRKAIRALTMVFLLTGGLVAMSGCSSKSSSSTSNTCPTPTPLIPGTTAGTYTVKITGTSGSTSSSTTFSLTIS